MHRLVVAAVTLLGLLAGSVVAGYLMFFSAATDRLAAMAPSSSAAYVSVYLSPSTGQQLNLAGLIGRLPGFADASTLDEKIDQVIGNLLGNAGIDYVTQVKPWLGDQVAAVAWPTANDAGEPQAVLIVDVKDLAAAQAAVPELLAAMGGSFETQTYRGVDLHVAGLTAYAFVGETVVIGQSAAAVEAVVDVVNGAASLGTRSDFADAMARLPADHLASAFLDLAALTRASGEGEIEGFSTASAALVAEADGLRLSGYAPIDLDVLPDGAPAGPSGLAAWMPADALAAAVLVDPAGVLEAGEPALGGSEMGDEALGLLDTVRALAAFGLGMDLDADVLPLLDGELGISVTDLGGTVPSAQLFLRPDDPSSLAEQLDEIVGRLAAVGAEPTVVELSGIEVTVLSVPDIGEASYAVVDGVAILALAPDDVVAAIVAQRGGMTLSETEAYRQAFEVAGTREGSEAFIDIGTLVDLGIADATGVTVFAEDVRDILSQLGALAISLPPREDLIEFHAAITVSDRDAE